MGFLRDELGVQDFWHTAQRYTYLLPAFAICMAVTALFMYCLFRSALTSSTLC